MSEPLYTRDILRLAVSIPHQQRLEHPDGSAEQRSRTCGSVVTADVVITDDETLELLGLTINACALGQASAAILGAEAIGRTVCDIVRARSDFPGDWQNMDKLAVAKDHRGRHGAILLPYDALIAAFADTAKRKAA